MGLFTGMKSLYHLRRFAGIILFSENPLDILGYIVKLRYMQTMRTFLKITKALSDKTRVRIFKMLQQRKMCVCEVQALLDMAQSTVSKHLTILEDAGLVSRTKDGLWVNYEIDRHSHNPHAAPIIELLSSILDDDPDVKADMQKVHTVSRFEICAK